MILSDFRYQDPWSEENFRKVSTSLRLSLIDRILAFDGVLLGVGCEAGERLH